MMVKDLMVDLEKGNRIKEHLIEKKVVNVPSSPYQQAMLLRQVQIQQQMYSPQQINQYGTL